MNATVNVADLRLDARTGTARHGRRRELQFSRNLKPAILAPGDALDVGTWSGTPFFMTMALQALYPELLPVRSPFPGWLRPARRVTRRLTAERIDLQWSRRLASRHADRLATHLLRSGVDVAFCIGTTPLTAFMSARMPTVHVSDATVALMTAYYPKFGSLAPRLAAGALALDREAVLQSQACLFPTAWAAQSAIRDYGADPARVHVIPFGANIDAAVPIFRPRPSEAACCNLVFIGMDWQRKGGDIAVAALHHLRDRGIAATLDIIGAAPVLSGRTDGIKVHGYLDKSTEDGSRRFNKLLRDAHFVLVPTRQDCYGVFAAEANAFGVPVISTRTGGVPGAVTDGANGYLLPLDAGGSDYANVIAALWASPTGYRALRASSFQQFNTVLNWRSWSVRAAKIVDALML